MDKQNERVKLTTEQAIAMLPDCEYVHTLRNGRGVMVGIDWQRVHVIEHITEYGAELAGDNATRMGHGMVIIDTDGALFIETKAVQP